MGLSTPSAGIACGASPLTLACARHGRPLHRTPLGCGDTPLAALLSEGCMGTLLSPRCFRRGVWGHSSRRVAFGGVYGTLLSPRCFRRGVPILSPASTVQIACNYWGSRRPLHRHKPAEPPLHEKEDTKKTGRLSNYWIGSPAGIPGGRAAFRF